MKNKPKGKLIDIGVKLKEWDRRQTCSFIDKLDDMIAQLRSHVEHETHICFDPRAVTQELRERVAIK